MRRLCIVSALIIVLASATASNDLDISASPRFGFEPFSTRVRITIQPHPDNRIACFVYDGAQYSNSCWQLEGEKAPKTTWKVVENLPGGPYLFTIVVRRSDGSIRQATTNVCSIPRGADSSVC